MRSIRSRLLVLIAVALTVVAAALTVAPSAEAFPARSKQDVLNYLSSITGSSVVSGQHNKEPASAPGAYTQQVKDITGQYPGLWGGDLMFRAEDVANRQRVIDQAKTEWANGSLVALTWHVCPPTGGSSCEFEGGVKSNISNAQFSQIITNGTSLNGAWKRRLDEVVPYLTQLKAAGIPVLFRPLHEMNEAWNWWGNRPGPDGGARLFQITRDYLDSKGLNNLIWVWNVQDNPAGGWSSYYPGNNYADVVSLDVWYKGYPSQSDYQQIRNIAGSKPIAIGEMGKVPNADLLNSQTRWSYFMIWSEQLRENNSNAEIQATYSNSRVLNQGEVQIPGGTGGGDGSMRTGAIVGLANKCVDVNAAGTANGTAVQLYTCATGVAQTWTVGTDGTIRNPNSGKCLGVASAGTANGTPVQIWDCNGSGAQQWQHNTSNRTLRNPASNKCLDVRGGSSADRTRLQIWDCSAGANQQWSLPA